MTESFLENAPMSKGIARRLSAKSLASAEKFFRDWLMSHRVPLLCIEGATAEPEASVADVARSVVEDVDRWRSLPFFREHASELGNDFIAVRHHVIQLAQKMQHIETHRALMRPAELVRQWSKRSSGRPRALHREVARELLRRWPRLQPRDFLDFDERLVGQTKMRWRHVASGEWRSGYFGVFEADRLPRSERAKKARAMFHDIKQELLEERQLRAAG